MSIQILLLIILILCIFNKRMKYYKKMEQYKCSNTKFQNHHAISASNLNNFISNKIPRKEYIHNRHPYLYIVNDLSTIFPPNNPLVLEKWNAKPIINDKKSIDITTDYIIKMLQIKYKFIYFLIETKNYFSHEIIDQYNPHYGKKYSIYDLVLQQDGKSDYIIFNVHIVNNDIVKIDFMSTETTDIYKLNQAYTDNNVHRADFGNDVLYN